MQIAQVMSVRLKAWIKLEIMGRLCERIASSLRMLLACLATRKLAASVSSWSF